MVDVVVTRKFRLNDLDLSAEFNLFRNLVNDQIRQGLQLPQDVFEKISLVSVKRYYKLLNNCKCALRERVHRCAAQYSYFSIREYRRNQANLTEILQILLANGFFANNFNEIQKKTDLSVFEIDNKVNFIRNLMLGEFDHIDLDIFYRDAGEQIKYQDLVKKTLGDRDFLVKILKSFNHRSARQLNKRFRELRSASYPNTSNYDRIILQILGLDKSSDVSLVSDYEWNRAKKKYREKLKNTLFSTKISINNWGSIRDETLLLRGLLKGHRGNKWINGASLSDLLKFIQQEFDDLLLEQMLEYYKIQFLPKVNKFLAILLKDLKKQVPTRLKIPEFRKSSIPFGIDDGQAYQLEEEDTNNTLNSVDMRISMTTASFKIARIHNIDRYRSMKEKGFSAQRGVLSFSRGKYYIYIPFKKKANEKRDSDLIASADLGLKTFATLSVFDKNKEIDRKFLDQKNLGGKKEDWFTSGDLVNLKSKLMEHRYVAKAHKSVRMRSKQGTIKHWYSRNIEKSKWVKIGNTHQELVHQIASRIIAYLNHHGVSTLVLENLKWSKHSSKNQVGYFLGTWQIHWFFSQVQELLVNMALLHGIHVELVNPRNSSRTCWKCGEFGKRNGKRFVCTSKSCGYYQVDSDLNAARNLILRSKRYRRLLSSP